MDEEDMDEEREARVLYNLNVTTGLGRLPISSTDVIVDILPPRARMEEYYEALSLSNHHFLVCEFIDYVERGFVYQRYDQTVGEYIVHLKEKNITPLMTFTVPNSGLTYDYIPNEYRKMVKSMIEFIVELHLNNGKSLREFSLDNMVIKHGVVKFWKLRFVLADEKRRKCDFRFLEVVIKQLFENRCPTIITDLFRMMSVIPPLESERSFLKHLAILSSQERIAFFKGGFDKREEFNPYYKGLYERVLGSMGNNFGWTRKFLNDNVGEYGPIKECLFHGQQQNPQQSLYIDQRSSREKVNLELLRFIRNLASHLRSYVRACVDDWYEIDDECIELSIMAVFELQFLRFQKELVNVGLLDHFI